MYQHTRAILPLALENPSLPTDKKVRSDLLILRHMARRMHTHLLGLTKACPYPVISYAEEQRNRTHRMVVYHPQEAEMLTRKLTFIGFIGGLQGHVSPTTIQEIHRMDNILLAELAHHPGLISYSSLELHQGRWYNLVLLNNEQAKHYFHHNSTHSYAAQLVATYYYAWIRLHTGVMPVGLVGNDMRPLSTKYYRFPIIGQKPLMQEKYYDGS
jgi:hypothetical protein